MPGCGMMTFEDKHIAYQSACNSQLRQVVNAYFEPASKVCEAAAYTLMNGGKRVRGVLVQAVCEMLGGQPENALAFAAALEMVHAFSLIHDDLPCMDNDDMRRGKPAAHIAYGEATALLAGDMLALQAFEVASCAPHCQSMAGQACAVLAAAAGAKGMIYGQELDLYYERHSASRQALEQVQTHKTGALFLAAVQLGGLAAGKTPPHIPALAQFAAYLGRVFQIVDDILDVSATTDTLGKPVGSDREQGKATFVSVLGLDEAREEAKRLTEAATAVLQNAYGEEAWFLAAYAQRLLSRLT